MKYLSGHKKFFIFICAAACLFFSACARVQPPDDAALLAALLAEGTLAPIDPAGAAAAPRLAQAERGDLIFPWHAELAVYFPNTYYVAFDLGRHRVWSHGRVRLGHGLTAGDEAEAGHFIGEVFFEDYTVLEIERAELAFQQEQFETRFADEQRRQRSEITALERALPDAPHRETAVLTLNRQRLAYDLFIRENDRQREEFARQAQALEDTWLGQRLYAPAGGVVTFVAAAEDEIYVRNLPWTESTRISPDGHPIWLNHLVTVVDDRDIRFTVQGFRHVYRYGDVLAVSSVIAGEAPSFNVRVAVDPLIFPVSRTGEQAITLVPEDPAGLREMLAAYGLRPLDLRDIPLRIDAPAVLAADAVLIPAEALQAEGLRTFVFVYDHGVLRRRFVDPGVVIGPTVQILAGLAPGQWVVLP